MKRPTIHIEANLNHNCLCYECLNNGKKKIAENIINIPEISKENVYSCWKHIQESAIEIFKNA